MRYPCPVCGFLTFTEEPPGTYDICPVCFWEDDPVQAQDPDFEGGANSVSMNVAKRNFRSFGACEQRFTSQVRDPTQVEIP
jgi:rubredoxin